jgi:hypothetical protein
VDADKLNHLTNEQRARYRVLEALFESEGWKLIKEQLVSSAQQQEQRMLNAQNWDTHRHAAGARAAYAQVVSLPEMVENEFEQLAETEAAKITLIGHDELL